MVTCMKENCPMTGENTCCHFCERIDSCPTSCAIDFDGCPHAAKTKDENALVAFESQYMAVFKAIRDVVVQKKAAEAQEKELKDQLKKAMEVNGIKAVDNKFLKITYVPETVSNGLDTAMIKRKYPTVAAECVKATPKSSYIKIEVKE